LGETHPEKRLIGYARVNTVGHSLDSQLDQLRAAGCSKIYREGDGRELLKMLKALVSGDIVAVTRIDRLTRSTFDLLAIGKQTADAGRNPVHWAELSAATGHKSAGSIWADRRN
jgi:DNA invertase Pin-like site-specific DNA recombinase